MFGYNSRNKNMILYPNRTAVGRRTGRGPGLPVLVPLESIGDVLQSSFEVNRVIMSSKNLLQKMAVVYTMF